MPVFKLVSSVERADTQIQYSEVRAGLENKVMFSRYQRAQK